MLELVGACLSPLVWVVVLSHAATEIEQKKPRLQSQPKYISPQDY